jgi:hypothetical protein
MNARTARRLAWPLWSLTLVLMASGFAVAPAYVAGPSGVIVLIATLVFGLAFATVGALLMRRRSHNPIGWLMAYAALCYGIGAVSVAYTAYGEVLGRRPLPGGALADQVGGWVWTVGLTLGGIFVLLLFPDGHPPSSRWRPAVWVAALALTMFVVGSVIAPGPSNGFFGTNNPTGIPTAEALAGLLKGVGVALLMLSMLAAVASLVARWRSSRSRQRQQLKWLVYAALMVVVGVLVSAVIESAGNGSADAVDLANATVTFGLAAIPMATGVAILRHRLYDIDRIINRTLVYGGLTAILGGAYVLIAAVAGTVVQGSEVVTAGATLAVAALFRPLRRRIQRFIDRHFYRSKYDATKTMESFSARLRDQVSLDSVTADLLGVVHDTMQPAHASLWLRQRP